MPDVPDGARLLGADTHRTGRPEREPFGEEVAAPESRTIPEPFHGSWRWEGAGPAFPDDDGREVLHVVAADHVDFGSGREPVVAVRRIPDVGIAVVTQQVDEDGWDYCLRYFGVSDDGRVLTDLESADMRYLRA